MSVSPPKNSGMTEIAREKFTKVYEIPALTASYQTHTAHYSAILKYTKKILFKAEHFQAVNNGKILLDPRSIKEWKDLPTENLIPLDINEDSFSMERVELKYENFTASQLMKAILPEGVEPINSFSQIGHIVHLNLRDNQLPFKTAIAQILRDKNSKVRTVVNKAANIENTYRNFTIDLLLGDADYKAYVKENGSIFEFDFSTVYWNPRLSSEHERIVELISSDDYLYDVFAGVGPFAVPAAKKRATVLANDLNPSSYKWLKHNVFRNKIDAQITTFNKDGRDFILEDVKKDLLERIEKREADMISYKIHITMNLPGLAVEFLNAFIGLLKNNDKGITSSDTIPTPICYCYCFVKGVGDKKAMAKQHVEEHMGINLVQDETLKNISFIRNVAPNKDMMRVDILLTSNILFDIHLQKRPSTSADAVPTKKQRK